MDVRLIDLQHITDGKGDLVVAELGPHGFSFRPERAFWFYNLGGEDFRGGHANHKCQQIIVAVSGKWSVYIGEPPLGSMYGSIFWLDDPTKGLYIGPSAWRSIRMRSTDGVCLVLASRTYDESDYIRTVKEYEEVWGK